MSLYLLIYSLVYVFTSVLFFFFKQKTAYEMRISDWSSDVCSSDLHQRAQVVQGQVAGVLDLEAEGFLCQQRGVGAGHAALHQVALALGTDRARDVRVAGQRPRHQP